MSPPQTSPTRPAVFWPVWSAAMAVSFGLGIGGILWVKGREGPFWATLLIGLTMTAAVLWLTYGADRRCYAVRGRFSTARKRYLWRMLPSMALYAVLLFISVYVFRTYAPTGAVAVLLAIAPAAPLVVAAAALGLYAVEEEDEFQRVVQMQAFIMATAMTMAVCTVWGFLDTFKVVPHAPMWLIFPIWAVGLGIAQPIVRGRYR